MSKGERLPQMKTAATLIVCAVLITIVVPGYFAHRNGVFERSGVCDTIKRKGVDSAAALRCSAYLLAETTCEQERVNFDLWIASAAPKPNLANEIDAFKKSSEACDKLIANPPGFVFLGFAEDNTVHLYLVFYLSMGLLVALVWRSRFPVPISPSLTPADRPNAGRVFLALFVIASYTVIAFCYCVYYSSIVSAYGILFLAGVVCGGVTCFAQCSSKCISWCLSLEHALRAACGAFVYLVFTDGPISYARGNIARTIEHGRSFFSYRNYNIDPASWVLESLRNVIWAILIAWLWLLLRSPAKGASPPKEIANVGNGPQLRGVQDALEAASRAFSQWQVRSALLAIAFLPWTYYDGVAIARVTSGNHGEVALYWYMAIVDHLTWIATWVLLSSDVVEAFAEWRRTRRDAFREQTQSPPLGTGNPDLVKAVLEKTPVSDLQLLFVSIAGGSALLWPTLRILFK